MAKKKEAKDAKNNKVTTATWTKGKPTGQLVHNCISEVHKKLEQLHKKNPKLTKKVLGVIYSKIIDKHVKIIEKNMGISYIDIKFRADKLDISKWKDLITKHK